MKLQYPTNIYYLQSHGFSAEFPWFHKKTCSVPGHLPYHSGKQSINAARTSQMEFMVRFTLDFTKHCIISKRLIILEQRDKKKKHLVCWKTYHQSNLGISMFTPPPHFEKDSQVAQAGRNLSRLLRNGLEFWSFCVSLPTSGINSVHPHGQSVFYFRVLLTLRLKGWQWQLFLKCTDANKKSI